MLTWVPLQYLLVFTLHGIRLACEGSTLIHSLAGQGRRNNEFARLVTGGLFNDQNRYL